MGGAGFGGVGVNNSSVDDEGRRFDGISWAVEKTGVGLTLSVPVNPCAVAVMVETAVVVLERVRTMGGALTLSAPPPRSATNPATGGGGRRVPEPRSGVVLEVRVVSQVDLRCGGGTVSACSRDSGWGGCSSSSWGGALHGFNGRFPSAFIESPEDSLVCDDEDVSSWDPARADAGRFMGALGLAAATMVEADLCEPVSDPWDECELALRGITGLRLVAVEATIRLVGAGPFSPAPRCRVSGCLPALIFSRLVERGFGGGGILDTPVVVDVFVAAAGAVFSPFSGMAGGRVEETAILPEERPSSSLPSSSTESSGTAKRAVGRGLEDEGPLEFFRIGCAGGGREDEGVGRFGFDLDELESS